MTSGRLAIRAQGATHVGSVREANEDSMIVDPQVGLYAVFDGMGGAMAGDVASQRARDVVKEYVRARRGQIDPRTLLETALNAASAAVHGEATARRDRRGMGTTAVVCLIIDEVRAVIAHVGDSRAYLLREGRLNQLTRDHTVVAELLAQNAIRPDEAENHAYKSVLSRNLGGKPEARAEVCEVALARGDRLMLCSDGLYGFASTEAVQQLLNSTDSPEQVSKDLIEAALRGGGGDNVTVVVIEAGVAAVPRATQMVRTTGSVSWWARKEAFLSAAKAAGLAENPICAVLSPAEAMQIVAGNFVEALYHDLEKSTTVNVWTFAENVAHGWLDRGGAWTPLRQLLDILHHACGQVIADLRRDDEVLALLLDAAVVRELTVAEMAVGGVLGEQLRAVETELVKLYAARETAAAAAAAAVVAARAPVAPQPQRTFTDHPTLPFLRKEVPIPAASPEVKPVLQAAASTAAARERDPIVRDVLGRLYKSAVEAATAATITVDARELFGSRPFEERALAPVFDAIDRARRSMVTGIQQSGAFKSAQVAAMRQLAISSQRLASAMAALVVEATLPGADKLREAMKETAALRTQVGKNEAKLADLERKFATVYDPMQGKFLEGIGLATSPGLSTMPGHLTPVPAPQADPRAAGKGVPRQRTGPTQPGVPEGPAGSSTARGRPEPDTPAALARRPRPGTTPPPELTPPPPPKRRP